MINDSRITRFNVIATCVFAILSIIGILHHEVWLDEAHHWLLARDSSTLKELFENARYEGHPLLWNILLFICTRFFTDVIAMQIINVIISVAAVFLFLSHAPFTKLEKCLFIMGNFILYEYTVISRNYSLLIFFLFLSIIFYQKKKYIALALALAALANTHLFGLIISSTTVLVIAFEILVTKTRIWEKALLIGFVIIFVGSLISVIQIVPPLNSTLYHQMNKSSSIDRLARMSVVFIKGFIPIPDFSNVYFWNTNLLMGISKPFCALLSTLLFAYPLIIFKRYASLLVLFYFSSLCILTFFYLSDLNAVRYYGVMYIVFVMCMWLLSLAQSDIKGYASTKYVGFFFKAVLVIQMIAGVTNYILDFNEPFSESKNVAAFLKAHEPKAEYIAGGCGAAPISAYLNKKMYYLTDQRYGSFCNFNRQSDYVVANTELALKTAALNFASKCSMPVLYIANSILHLSPEETVHFKFIRSFNSSAVKHENYYVYEVLDGEGL